MIRNEVIIYTESVAKVAKGLNAILIVRCGLVVCLVHETAEMLESPYISEVKVLSNTGQAQFEWEHLIGKMCHEKASSNYFRYWRSMPNLVDTPKVQNIDNGELPFAIIGHLKVALGDPMKDHGAVVTKKAETQIEPEMMLRSIAGEDYDFVLKYLPNSWQLMDEDLLRSTVHEILSNANLPRPGVTGDNA